MNSKPVLYLQVPWFLREKLSQKNIYLMLVLLWHQYVRHGMFSVSRKGTFAKDLTTLPSKGVCLALKLLSPVTKLNIHHGEKMFVWFRSYFHRSRSQTLISPGRKSNAFEKVPFLGTKNVPRLIYWGHNKTNTR